MLEDLLREGAGTVVGRWYVTLFGIVFVWCAVRDLGWRRTAIYTAIALVVGGLAENGSVHLGIPYTGGRRASATAPTPAAGPRGTRSIPIYAATNCSSATSRSWFR